MVRVQDMDAPFTAIITNESARVRSETYGGIKIVARAQYNGSERFDVYAVEKNGEAMHRLGHLSHDHVASKVNGNPSAVWVPADNVKLP